jgi:hypothetical protein
MIDIDEFENMISMSLIYFGTCAYGNDKCFLLLVA